LYSRRHLSIRILASVSVQKISRLSTTSRSLPLKDSTEGNEEEQRLAPLMFPGTVPTDAAFIANHHYRAIQNLLEDLD